MEREKEMECRREELEILFSEEFREEVEANIERDSNAVALDRRLRHPRQVATQVKYLQRARRKLPSYFTHRAILPPLAFEQSSSEECAAHKRFEGHLAVDLTCGLGVDSLHLASRFERVVAIERNGELAAITRHNFNLMGISNVEVVEGSAEEFLPTLTHADLIYADPDRRSAEGRKLVTLEDCSPNIAALLPTLKSKCDHLAVKLSPMFDIKEALVAFGQGTSLEVISLRGEVKEIVAYWSATPNAPSTITATALGTGSFEVAIGEEAKQTEYTSDPTGYNYLIVPDAALRKAGTLAEWCAKEGLTLFGAYALSKERPREGLMGRIYIIEVSLPYQPSKLRKLVGRNIEIVRHSFPHSSAAICKALGAREGAGSRWAFAEASHSLWALKIIDA